MYFAKKNGWEKEEAEFGKSAKFRWAIKAE